MRRVSWLLAWLVTAPAFAHGGEDHGEAPPPVASTQGEVHTLAAAGDVFEVVLKHPEHGEGGKTPLRVFVAEMDTNAPVSGAQVELTLTGPTLQTLVAKMDSPGVYLTEADLPVEAEFAAVATVTRGDSVDVLALGTVHLEPEEVAATSRGGRPSAGWIVAVVAGLGILVRVAWVVSRRARKVTP